MNPRPSPWQGDALPLSYSRIRHEAVYRSPLPRVNAGAHLLPQRGLNPNKLALNPFGRVNRQIRLHNRFKTLLDVAIERGGTILGRVSGIVAGQTLFRNRIGAGQMKDAQRAPALAAARKTSSIWARVEKVRPSKKM